MIFTKTSLEDAFIVELEKKEDHRGFFARSWDTNEFAKHNLNHNLVQCNISFSKKRGTLRGMHYQTKPFEESKLIRCTKGKIFDVIIDLRSKSKTYKKWFGVELSQENYKMLYVPEGFAHGFQSLEDDTEIFYQVSQFYTPKAECGIHWNDPSFNIKWPIDEKIITEKDNSWILYDEKTSLTQ
ncbi:dTDP-4-dehydrorhamnose 3,5-epimerase [Candidatus Nitrosopumilus sediminis]|uniref:dTDP-4-dehydrorhamnose 3,5-epimerase n=1 Tax=Candidatus Nitrosopumilus sediminis TaxID=1229909 RepID=K0BEC0_9ARCH|nr:dTDP-4-dehydrorhamnose 3,5-epimerase [Candidatus Nitrosopumilus sediminis]AFS83789.1 dTDP-4-dehydrorhamnose 3,5-epimerase [Candidatus Nitrosopumilus sediminis]